MVAFPNGRISRARETQLPSGTDRSATREASEFSVHPLQRASEMSARFNASGRAQKCWRGEFPFSSPPRSGKLGRNELTLSPRLFAFLGAFAWGLRTSAQPDA